MAALIIVALIIYGTLSGIQLELTTKISENMGMYVGGLAGVTIVLGIIGYFIGNAFKK